MTDNNDPKEKLKLMASKYEIDPRELDCLAVTAKFEDSEQVESFVFGAPEDAVRLTGMMFAQVLDAFAKEDGPKAREAYQKFNEMVRENIGSDLN